jgi:hypothetical protein
MDDRETLVLAVCIGEWAAVCEHIAALDRVGESAPYVVQGRTRSELDNLCTNWALRHGDLMYDSNQRTRVIEEARAYCTERVSEIDDLTNGE